MLKYIIRRLLVMPAIILLVTAILFLVLLQVPVEQRAGVYLPSANPHLTEKEYAALVEATITRYGLNEPFYVQYWNWLRNLARGEWGYSPASREPVLTALRRRAPATIELTIYAMIPASLLAVATGSAAARRRGRLADRVVRIVTFIGWAFPPFILALLFMSLFYAWLGWFPPERMSIWASQIVNSDAFLSYTGLLTVDALLNGQIGILVDALRHLALPASSLGILQWALLTRIMRASLIEVLGDDYIVTARAKGVPEPQVIGHHARRNALLPVISAGGVATSMLITWVVVIETVFNYNGVGRWAAKAILQADIPVAIGFAMFACSIVILASLVADLMYAVVDPRVRLF
ncbi:MAG: ABC transporter permease [Anaerolineae bacterium]|nr:ABC transporter permease [Anaerolineae bacterium]